MKKLFGVALLALPLLTGSLQATGWPFNVQAGGTLYIKGGPGPCHPQAGPWYLYWPLESHFVAPAPTGYPYWPPQQGLPNISFGGPSCPPGVPVPPYPPPVTAAPRVATAPPPATMLPPPVTTVPPPVTTTPIPAPQTAPALPPQAPPPAGRQIQLPPYLQPTSYYPLSGGQVPSYWYDR